MIVNDPLYGSTTITDPVLVELLQSAPVLRMKKVRQFGVPFTYTLHKNFTRHEHTQGVMLLLRKLGASVEEQIAGLLHDISHPAFSHTIDRAIGNPEKQDFQDATHREYLYKTEIPRILKSHGFTPEKVMTLEGFPLLDRPAPELCADRIDYTLRETAAEGDLGSAQRCIRGLCVAEGRIAFTSCETATLFWKLFANCQMNHWGNPQFIASTHLLGMTLKEAFQKQLLTFEDMYLGDEEVFDKLRSSGDPKITELIEIMDQGYTALVDEKSPDAVLKVKFRHVDPAFIEQGKRMRVSEVLPEYASWLAAEKNRYKRIPLKILRTRLA